MIKAIYDHLKAKNLNPYFIGQHKGECTERFCVIKENSQVPYFYSNKLGYRLIDIIVFVPLNSYIAVEPYMTQIRSALKELDFLRKTGFESPAITDDEKKAYTSSIEYTIVKKLEG